MVAGSRLPSTSGDISAHQQLSLACGTDCPGDVVGGQPCQQTLESDGQRVLRWPDRTSCTVVTPVPSRTERAQRWRSLKSVGENKRNCTPVASGCCHS